VVNRLTPRLVIADYRPGAGGKFLLNALALAPGFVLQSADLARRELAGTLLSQNKLQELLERYSNTSTAWHDLDLGCQQLFGVSAGQHLAAIDQGLDIVFDPVINELSDQSHTWFPLVSHSHWATLTYLQAWPQARVIVFHNDRDFVEAVGRQPDNEISNTDQDLKTIRERAMTWDWDCTWFLDAGTMQHRLSQLYQWFGLDGFDADSIETLRQHWLAAIDRTKVLVKN
jgi:hypothetical protein